MKIPRLALLALCFAGPVVHAQAAKQTMAEAAQAMDVCRRVPKADRDQMIGEQVSRAWLATGPSAAAEKQDNHRLPIERKAEA